MTEEKSRYLLRMSFEEQKPKFDRLCANLQDALKIFLHEKRIDYLAISGRTKLFDSFADKCERKKYSDPFNENEDFVGVRVIVYFPDDVDRVCKIIDEEFDVVRTENKAEQLDVDKFGYRSHHKIVTVKKSWAKSPNYRNVGAIKAEIQVRTVLMHAWAEVEHKLQYKNENSIPSSLRRKSFLLSAKFEEADEQFQLLRDGIREYEISITDEDAGSIIGEELNADSLKIYMDEYYGDRGTYSKNEYSDLIDEMRDLELSSINEVDNLLQITNEAFQDYENHWAADPDHPGDRFRSIGVLRVSSELYRTALALSKGHKPNSDPAANRVAHLVKL